MYPITDVFFVHAQREPTAHHVCGEHRVIFATCGSSTLRFPRMMEALRQLPAEDLYVQHGLADPPPCASAYDFLPFERMVELIEQADVVVTHAGVGSIMCAVQAGHVPVVFPRLKRYSEAPDDHQVELAKALAAQGTVVAAWSADDLAETVAHAPSRGPARAPRGQELIASVRAAIYGSAPQPQRPQTAPTSAGGVDVHVRQPG